MKLGGISVALAAIVFSMFSWQVRLAENTPPVVGTWRVTSFSLSTLDTNEVSRPYGENPIGYIQYSPGGHMVVFFRLVTPKDLPPFHSVTLNGRKCIKEFSGHMQVHTASMETKLPIMLWLPGGPIGSAAIKSVTSRSTARI